MKRRERRAGKSIATKNKLEGDLTVQCLLYTPLMQFISFLAIHWQVVNSSPGHRGWRYTDANCRTPPRTPRLT